ncbi:MAG: DUF1657 domain-containing protein [Clostridia bacterium]|nr:DUF1657 domain-containing protein [Clostridia bacterium]
MTVGTQMQQALANLESTKSDMQTFALQTQDKQAKAAFNQYAQQLESITNSFKQRVDYIQQQEPQFKGS